ncbi:winged helix-turn-helix transcriptional regulator [Halodesulfurarchaeum formicicum]|uniref:MarR family transcriptional regulator n=1 Tax=Halodesulfurarchaeum formicicum TaxID=1873524 RepID=A0A1J1ADU0_9EURY|nr:MarR family transcriptional regulator [Halodesulfurarchaeum formicicum]APE95947.1 MarR family transcriptional regulator [Halodesulfurarchaeum formicicum]
MGIDEEKRTTLRKFAAVGAGSPLLGLAGQDEGASETREAIAGYVERTPGAHFSKIRDDLGIATGETQYHLRRLTDQGTLERYRDGDYKRFYPAGRFDAFEQVTLGYLRRETPRAMVCTLLQEPTHTGASLSAAIGVSPATVSNHATEMAEHGVLDRSEGYRVNRPETVITLLVRYAESFDAETVNFAADAADLLRYEP